MRRERYTSDELHARLIVSVGIILAVIFAVMVIGITMGLLFISQPLEQSPNDAAFIDLMSTIVVFMTGTLSGLVASNNIRNKQTPPKP